MAFSADGEVLSCSTVTTRSAARRFPTMTRRAFFIWIAAAGVLGFGIRFGVFMVDVRSTAPSGDAVFYHETANLLADGKGYINPFIYNAGYCMDLGGAKEGGEHTYSFLPSNNCASVEKVRPDGTIERIDVTLPPGTEMPTAGHPPLWSYILSVFSRLGFDSVNQHRMIGLLIGCLGVVLIGLAGREIFDEGVGVVSAFIAAVYGFLWLNDGSLMSESLVVVFVPIITMVAVRWWRNPKWRTAVLLGLLSGLGGLIRTELLAYGPMLVLVAFIVRRAQWRSILRDLGLVTLVCLAVLAPWLVRNLTSFEKPIYLSPTGTLLAQTNCDATYFGEKIGYWERFCGEPEPVGPNGEFLDESERDTIRRGWAKAYMSDHPMRLVTVAAPMRVLRMFNIWDSVQTARFDIYVENRDFRQSIFALVEYFVVVLAAIAGGVIAWRRRLTLFPVVLWPILVAGVAAMSFGNNRYRVSAEPSFIWLASLAACSLLVHLRDRNRTAVSETTTRTATSPS